MNYKIEDKELVKIMNRLIYLDNAATTKTRKEVIDAMLPYFDIYYGNASSIYTFSSPAKQAISDAKEVIASTINAKPKEIYFTAGGSESDNWALVASCEYYMNKGKHVITSSIEHHGILNTCKYLEERGFEVTYLPVDENGFVSEEDLKKAIREDTILISIMLANNEIGTIEPIKKLSKIAKDNGIVFHTDAVQAYGHIPIDVEDMGIDILSASGHKFGGPKGIGFMYIRTGVPIKSFIHGGDQQRRRRAGTENTPGIVGMAKACELAHKEMEITAKKEIQLRDHLINRVLDEIPYVVLNGDRLSRLPNNACFSFRFIEGESMLMKLDMVGVCASSGSACTSGQLEPSHVLLAIGRSHDMAHGSLRVSLSSENTLEEIDYLVDNLKVFVRELRDLSPLYDDFVKKNNN